MGLAHGSGFFWHGLGLGRTQPDPTHDFMGRVRPTPSPTWERIIVKLDIVDPPGGFFVSFFAFLLAEKKERAGARPSSFLTAVLWRARRPAVRKEEGRACAPNFGLV